MHEACDGTRVREIEPRYTLFHPTRALWLEWTGATDVWDACAAAYDGGDPPITIISRTFKTGRDGRYDVARSRVAAMLEEVFVYAEDEAARAIEGQLTPERWARVKGPAIADIALWFHRRDGYSASRDALPVAYRLSAILEGAAAPASFDDVGALLEQWEMRLEDGVARRQADLRAYAATRAAHYRRFTDMGG